MRHFFLQGRALLGQEQDGRVLLLGGHRSLRDLGQVI